MYSLYHGEGTEYCKTGRVKRRGIWETGHFDKDATARHRKRKASEAKEVKKRQKMRDAFRAYAAHVPACVVCGDDLLPGDVSYVHVPCGHRTVCGSCVATLPTRWATECPVCKCSGGTMVRLFDV